MSSLAHDPILVAFAITLGVIGAWGVVLLFLRLHQEQKIRQFRGALSIILNTFREGRRFGEAVQVLADLGPKPLNGEFRRIKHRLSNNGNQAQILEEFCVRVPCFETEYLAAVLKCESGPPEEIYSRLLRLDQLKQRRQLALDRVVSLNRFARRGIRAALLAGPVLLTGIMLFRPQSIITVLSQMSAHAAAGVLLGGLFLSAAWFVLILQKQDEAEIVLE